MERLFAWLADLEQAEPKAFRQEFVNGLLEQAHAAREKGDAFGADVLGAMAQFVREPGSIGVHVDPAEPVALMRLMHLEHYMDAVRALNLHVEADSDCNQ